VSRSTGSNPASRIAFWSVQTLTSWCVPAPPTLVMSYHTTVPSMSSAPLWSISCAIGSVCMIQKALTCGKLSSIKRATASVRRFSSPAGPGRCSSSEPSGKKGSGMMVWKYPPRAFIAGVGRGVPGRVSETAPSVSGVYPSRASASSCARRSRSMCTSRSARCSMWP